MCIAVFVWQDHPLYPFLLLLNRDEFHNRPTKAVEWWDGGMILGGRDEVAGGTWLACSKQGRVSFLTNVLELQTCPEAKSRGDLPLRFLESKKSPEEFADELAKEVHQYYNGFNLIMVDLPSKVMVYMTNRPKGGEAVTVQQVQPGIHVLTNGRLDSPWPKAQRLKLNFKEFLRKDEDEIVAKEMIEKLMLDTTKADQDKLPRICSLDREYNMSSIFVEVDTPLGRYGTRSTAAVTVKTNGEVGFYETYLERDIWMEKSVDYRIQELK